MTRPLYHSSGADLQEMSDTQLDIIRYYVQRAYATQIENGGSGAFGLGSTYGTDAGSATDERRGRATSFGNSSPGVQAGDYPANTTETSTNYSFSRNQTEATVSSDATLTTVYHDNGDIRRHNNSSLATDIFQDIRADIRAGGLGCYRIQTTAPTGGGWTNVGSNAFINGIYSGNGTAADTYTTTSYNLYLRTGGVTAPTGSLPNLIYAQDDGDLRIHTAANLTSTGNLVMNYLLPSFTNWARGNGLRWHVDQGTSNIISTMSDTYHNSDSNRIINAPGWANDVYVTYPNTSNTTTDTYNLRTI